MGFVKRKDLTAPCHIRVDSNVTAWVDTIHVSLGLVLELVDTSLAILLEPKLTLTTRYGMGVRKYF